MGKMFVLPLALAFAWIHSPTAARKLDHTDPAKYKFMSQPEPAVLPAALEAARGPSLSTAVADTFHLAWFSFDSLGVATRQGWTSFDRTVQDTFFHVANSVELNGGLSVFLQDGDERVFANQKDGALEIGGSNSR